MTSLLTSNSMRMMEKSLEFLWVKQAAHLDNISNAETPGYKNKTVTFEESFEVKLREAARRSGVMGRKTAARIIEDSSWTVWEDDEDTRMDGNGVNITEQMIETMRTAYQQQYLFQTITSDITTLRSAITG